MTKSNTLSPTTCLLLLILVSLCLPFTKATVKIQRGKLINVSEIVNGDFELGLYSPPKSTTKFYVGIRYKTITESTYVWIANREYPVLTSSATLTINSDGNVVIREGRLYYMVTDIASTSKDVYATLLDSGNFVLRETSSGNTLWQSFDHPTNTLLPGMKFGEENSGLVSWKTHDDPSPGSFSVRLDSAKNQLIIMHMSDTCSVIQNDHGSFFDLISFSGGNFTLRGNTTSSEISWLVLDETGQLKLQSWSEKEKHWLSRWESWKYTKACNGITPQHQTKKDHKRKISRLVLDEKGQLKLQSWSEKEKHWLSRWESWKHTMACNGSTPQHRTKKDHKSKILIISSAIVTVLLLIFAIVVYYGRNHAKKGENLFLFDVEMSLKDNHSELPELNQRPKRGRKRKKPCKLVFFTFSSVNAATDNFSDAHKLGEGGYGPVYKGRLKKGDEVAIKRLSKNSTQGKSQFKNEAHLIARLQHKNLVRLLGCCIDRNQKILIYEYMPNKSLDCFLYDSTGRKHLTWPKRVGIIEGVAQGLLYLHQFSRIQIIHRDLKPGNILLDNDMNPKISDFGMARIFRKNQSNDNTATPAGTIGYMAPEYAYQGLFSERSDVYSFGVLLLEILRGRKNTDSHTPETRGLLAYAWELWTSDRGSDLMDPILEDASAKLTILRYVHIALLCVQEIAADRPNMSQVVSMLHNSSSALPYPKQPAFLKSTTTIRPSPLLNRQEHYSVNNVTISDLHPR